MPQIRTITIFGTTLSSQWLWSLDPSPAYVGQGALMGVDTSSHIMFGTILGWAVLSPIAKSAGWAAGPVDDFEHGAMG
jgi:uncharacterized oligopeptide transporter (OPT) family protein